MKTYLLIFSLIIYFSFISLSFTAPDYVKNKNLQLFSEENYSSFFDFDV